MWGMSYPSDLTDDQWALLEPVFMAPVALPPVVVRTRDAGLVAVPPLVARRHLGEVAAVVVPASPQENRASELMLEHLTRQGVTDRVELVLVDRGVAAAAAPSRAHSLTALANRAERAA